jgi:hypothetical protein
LRLVAFRQPDVVLPLPQSGWTPLVGCAWHRP